MPLETGINRFQILAFAFNLLVFIDTCKVQCQCFSAENNVTMSRIPNIKLVHLKLPGSFLKISFRPTAVLIL